MSIACSDLDMTHSSFTSHYIGRFAPSPSGPLHFGSLVTALGSFLQAKKHQGKWLVRIEDIDPPREVAGATESILTCLEAHHLFWDDTVLYQSQRTALYQEKIQYLKQQGCTFYCQCTRAQLAELPANQLCSCVNATKVKQPAAIRFIYHRPSLEFTDQLLGQVSFKPEQLVKQFAIQRKDGLFAYQLAVVVDDIEQGITEVARGADLLDATFYQLALYQAFNAKPPDFLHFPLVTNAEGKKLSKQNHASEVSINSVSSNLFYALEFLGLAPPVELKSSEPELILLWAIQAWDVRQLTKQRACIDNRIGRADSI
ncbi:tRNA glutamyl-Q(34) synthetase GluQRS [Paraglaciecola aestuariivivens]